MLNRDLVIDSIADAMHMEQAGLTLRVLGDHSVVGPDLGLGGVRLRPSLGRCDGGLGGRRLILCQKGGGSSEQQYDIQRVGHGGTSLRIADLSRYTATLAGPGNQQVRSQKLTTSA